MSLSVPNKADFHVNLSNPAQSSLITGPLSNTPPAKANITNNDILYVRIFLYTINPSTNALINQTIPTGSQVVIAGIIADTKADISLQANCSTTITAADITTPDHTSGIAGYAGTLNLTAADQGTINDALGTSSQIDLLMNIQISDSASSPTKRATVAWFVIPLLYDAYPN